MLAGVAAGDHALSEYVLLGDEYTSVSRQPSADSRYFWRRAWKSRLGERPASPSKAGPSKAA